MKKLPALLAAVVCASAVASCGSDAQTTPTPSQTAASAAEVCPQVPSELALINSQTTRTQLTGIEKNLDDFTSRSDDTFKPLIAELSSATEAFATAPTGTQLAVGAQVRWQGAVQAFSAACTRAGYPLTGPLVTNTPAPVTIPPSVSPEAP